MKVPILLCAALCLPLVARADQPKTEAKTDVVATSSTRNAAQTSWVAERGTMTTDEVISSLGIAVTAEQRAQIEKAVQERNESLRAANEKFSASLQKTLSADDTELSKRVADEKERRRMDLIRRRQPGRYNGMKKK